MSSVIWTGLKKAAGTAFKWVGGGTSSLYLYGALALAGAAAAGGTAWWHGSKVEEGFTRGHAAATAQHLAAENRALLLQAERIATLSNDLMEALNAYSITAQAVSGARVGADARGQRVRNAARPGDELDQRVGAAECGIVRTFATGAFRTAAACRDDVAALGLGSGGAVEAAASAHYEHARAEALRRFAMPRTPFNPSTNTPEKQP